MVSKPDIKTDEAHTIGEPIVAFGPAAKALIDKLEASPPVHNEQIAHSPQDDDCLYRGEVVEDVRDAVEAIEADGAGGAAGIVATLAEALADAQKTLIAFRDGDAYNFRLRPSVLRRHIAEIDTILAGVPASTDRDNLIRDAEFERVMAQITDTLRDWFEGPEHDANKDGADIDSMAAFVRVALSRPGKESR